MVQDVPEHPVCSQHGSLSPCQFANLTGMHLLFDASGLQDECPRAILLLLRLECRVQKKKKAYAPSLMHEVSPGRLLTLLPPLPSRHLHCPAFLAGNGPDAVALLHGCSFFSTKLSCAADVLRCTYLRTSTDRPCSEGRDSSQNTSPLGKMLGEPRRRTWVHSRGHCVIDDVIMAHLCGKRPCCARHVLCWMGRVTGKDRFTGDSTWGDCITQLETRTFDVIDSLVIGDFQCPREACFAAIMT